MLKFTYRFLALSSYCEAGSVNIVVADMFTVFTAWSHRWPGSDGRAAVIGSSMPSRNTIVKSCG